MDGAQPLDPRKTVFVGGVPRPMRAGFYHDYNLIRVHFSYRHRCFFFCIDLHGFRIFTRFAFRILELELGTKSNNFNIGIKNIIKSDNEK